MRLNRSQKEEFFYFSNINSVRFAQSRKSSVSYPSSPESLYASTISTKAKFHRDETLINWSDPAHFTNASAREISLAATPVWLTTWPVVSCGRRWIRCVRLTTSFFSTYCLSLSLHPPTPPPLDPLLVHILFFSFSLYRIPTAHFTLLSISSRLNRSLDCLFHCYKLVF